MKRMILASLILAVCLVFSACTPVSEVPDAGEKVVSPLPETLDINNLTDCTVSVSLEKGNAYVDDTGKMQMKVTVYSYALYDMVDIENLNVGDTILRRGEEVKITEVNRLETGLIHINGGEEKGGFSLNHNENTVFYESGMNDIKAFYPLGEVILPVSQDFVYADESDLDAEAKVYYAGDFLTEDAGIVYHFTPNNTSITIVNGEITKMVRRYMP